METRSVPASIVDEGILVGWSLEHEHQKAPVGFHVGEPAVANGEHLEPILLNDDSHLMTVAPTGAGKGIGCIIPTLLRWQGPVIVVDPKGENYAVTARRRREMGQEVLVFDPFGITGAEGATINPLDLIDPESPTAADDAASLAELLAPVKPDLRDPFWDEMARQLLASSIQHIATARPPVLRNLRELHYLVNQRSEDFGFTLKEMQRSARDEIRIAASAFDGTETKVMQSIRSTAQSALGFLRGAPVGDQLTRSSFDLARVTAGDPLSIYLVLPPDKLQSHSPLLRLWIATLITLITRRKSPPARNTLFILDEAAQLGTLAQFRSAVTLLRGYGLQTWSFWQDLSQLQRLYPWDWETVVNNCRAIQAFGIPNMRAAETLYHVAGTIRPEALVDLDADEMLLLKASDEPVIAQRPNYLTDPVFAGMADANPFHSPVDEDAVRPRRPQRRFMRRTTQSELGKLAEALDACLRNLGTAVAAEPTACASEPIGKWMSSLEETIKKLRNVTAKYDRAFAHASVELPGDDTAPAES
jgi:type IV secretion system protein VirD4